MELKLLKKELFFIIIITGLLTGCATWQHTTTAEEGKGEAKGLAVAALLKFDDVPVPSGFNILEKESFAFQNNLTRVGLLRYIGRDNADQVVSFYKEQMPLFNWDCINIIEYEKRVLNYERKAESCIITVERTGVGKTLITIAISPKSAPMKAETQKKE